MALGGARPGAGRKAGGRNRQKFPGAIDPAKEIARMREFGATEELTLEQIAGMSELEVMRHAMMLYAVKQNWASAAAVAKEIAPYRFAKLTSTKVEATVRRSVDELTDDELATIAGSDDGDAEEESED